MTAQAQIAASAARTAADADARPNLRASRLVLEANATFAVAWREVLRAIKSRQMIAINIIFPVLFMGLMGGMIQQNLGSALPFSYLPYMLVGMVAQTMYQGGLMGVTTLIEERENGFTAELFVAPITRYAVLLGRIVGASLASMVSLIGVLAMIVVMQIPVDFVDVLRVLVLAPVLALAGGALGVLFIGFVQDPKTADVGSMLLVMPQMFLAGSIIPNAGIVGDPGRAGQGDADDLRDRPRPKRLLRGQARVRVRGPVPLLRGPGRDRRDLRGLPGHRHGHVRSNGPQPVDLRPRVTGPLLLRSRPPAVPLRRRPFVGRVEIGSGGRLGCVSCCALAGRANATESAAVPAIPVRISPRRIQVRPMAGPFGRRLWSVTSNSDRRAVRTGRRGSSSLAGRAATGDGDGERRAAWGRYAVRFDVT